ncbi:uncharacterized protein rgr isoform X2 [Eurosta solidaginis]|uniref:uncharacterized protein rgr isoform X2 n=1 Tax=Eurosta solidaginis TaxID=178769 RepID=UPI0035314BC6
MYLHSRVHNLPPALLRLRLVTSARHLNVFGQKMSIAASPSIGTAQQVTNNWQLGDFACFRKCGEITVSPDAKTYGMNCHFCPGICLQFDVFVEHMREVHAERVSALYDEQQSQTLKGEKCEQSTQTPTEMESFSLGAATDIFKLSSTTIAPDTISNTNKDPTEDFEVDVECIDGFESDALFNHNCNYVATGSAIDSFTNDAFTYKTFETMPVKQQAQLRRSCRRHTALENVKIADKPPKVCSWNEVSSCPPKGTSEYFKTTITTITTPPTPAPTPSPWTSPTFQNGQDCRSTMQNLESKIVNGFEMEDTLTVDGGVGVVVEGGDDSLMSVDIDMVHYVHINQGSVEQNEPEVPQEKLDLVYIMESAKSDGVIEEEPVVDPFEMAQGWRCSTDTSEPLLNENEHSTEVIFYLLETYKNFEKLWNPNHPQYKYNANRKMFEELSRPLLRDMNYSLDGAEIYAIIKSLRTRYRLELTKARQRKGKYKTRFKYFDKMEFLRDIIENKRATRQTKNRVDSSSVTENTLKDWAETTRSLHNHDVLTCLLDAFRRQEALWNPQHPDYLQCNKNDLMRDISAELLLEKSVNMSADECFTEIQKLRTRYRRELSIAHEQKGLYAPKLWCFEQMEFLHKIFEDQLLDRLKKRKGVIACKPNTRYLKAKSINFKSTDDHLTFIEIYKSYSALWDVDHPDYRSTTYRNEELNQMLEEVNLMLGINGTLEELQKTLYELRKEFSSEKNKRLTEAFDVVKTSPPTPSLIVQTKLMEFLETNLGPFRCDVCKDLIKTSDQYKIHKSGHDGMQPFICTLCGKGFQIPGNLTIHIRRHKGDFPYSCAVCDKKFATSTEVAIHLRSHTGERPYICDICGKSFKTWSFYDTHRRGHLKQSNFLCPICDKAFYERNRYTDHMNGHLNIRKHACDVCGKSYTTFANLKKHTELHLPVKKYKCDICGQRFAQFASVRWHKRKMHTSMNEQLEQIEQ